MSALSTRLPSACSSRSRSPWNVPPPWTSIARPASAARGGEPARDGFEQLAGVELGGPQRRLAGAVEHEQILGEPDQALHLLRRRADRALELLGRPRAAQRELELRPQQGERRAQLVARVPDEAPLALEAGIEPLQHLVERLAEPVDLVARLREGRAGLPEVADEISAASRRIDSTGRSAAPASR